MRQGSVGPGLRLAAALVICSQVHAAGPVNRCAELRDDAERLAGDLEHGRQDSADGADKRALDAGLAILLDQRRHARGLRGVDGDHGIGLGLLDVGQADAEVGLLERELLDDDLLPGLAELGELGLDHGLRAVAIGVVLAEEADALGAELVDQDVGDDRAVLAVRAVEPHGVGVGLAGQDRIGLGHRGDV